MSDLTSYMMISFFSIGSFACFVWLLKQLLIVVRYAVKWYVTMQKD